MDDVEKRLSDLTKFFFENCDFEIIKELDGENTSKGLDFVVKKKTKGKPVKTGIVIKDFNKKSCGINVICNVDRLKRNLPWIHNLCVVSNSFSVPAENLARMADILILPRGHMVSYLRSKGHISNEIDE